VRKRARTEAVLPLPSVLIPSVAMPAALSTDSTRAAVSLVIFSWTLPVVTCSAGDSTK
jgi:hypothetical protein